jgi:hypothetical protein
VPLPTKAFDAETFVSSPAHLEIGLGYARTDPDVPARTADSFADRRSHAPRGPSPKAVRFTQEPPSHEMASCIVHRTPRVPITNP